MRPVITLEVKRNNLYIRYYYNDLKTIFKTGIVISPEFCDKKQNCIHPSYPDATKLNYQISLLTEKIKSAVIILDHQGIEPTPFEVRNIVLNIDSTHKKTDFFVFFDNFVSLKAKSTRISTSLNFKKLRNLLVGFQENCNYKITFDSINLNFYNQFQNYFSSKNLQQNYFASNIRLFNSVLNAANVKNIKLNPDVKNKIFKASFVTTDSIYLNDEELQMLINLDLSKYTGMERCRDTFIIGAYTGLRYSDICQLSDDKISDNILKIRNIKTGKWVNIPLHPAIQKIIGKRGKLPKPLDHSDFNKQIKKVAKRAGINQIVSTYKYIGKQIIESKEPKHHIISSHTMRRSFVTNLHHKGMPLRNIMDFSGHSTISSLERYIKSDLNESKSLLMNIWEM
ncbi:MAG: site-specific integrase [Bacteroidales bacterium]